MSISTEPTAALQQERDFFAAHQAEWKQRFPGKFALVKANRLVNTFDKAEDAVAEGLELFDGEPFLVRPVALEEQNLFIPVLELGLLN